ncbi:hypothetical protein D3C81_2001580 [compost metagenome]
MRLAAYIIQKNMIFDARDSDLSGQLRNDASIIRMAVHKQKASLLANCQYDSHHPFVDGSFRAHMIVDANRIGNIVDGGMNPAANLFVG